MVKILLVDDDDLVRYALSAFLRSAGHEVVEEPNGKKVLSVIAAEKPDILVTDIIMPEKEGTETIIDVRKIYPDFPIVAMSGGGRDKGDTYLNMAKALGANAVFQKPFDEAILLDFIEENCKKKLATVWPRFQPVDANQALDRLCDPEFTLTPRPHLTAATGKHTSA